MHFRQSFLTHPIFIFLIFVMCICCVTLSTFNALPQLSTNAEFYESQLAQLQRTLIEEQKVRRELQTDVDSVRSLLQQLVSEKQSRVQNQSNNQMNHSFDRRRYLFMTIVSGSFLESTIDDLFFTFLFSSFSQASDLSLQLERQRAEKTELQKQLSHVRGELARLRKEFAAGKPIHALLVEARALLQLPKYLIYFFN